MFVGDTFIRSLSSRDAGSLTTGQRLLIGGGARAGISHPEPTGCPTLNYYLCVEVARAPCLTMYCRLVAASLIRNGPRFEARGAGLRHDRLSFARARVR